MPTLLELEPQVLALEKRERGQLASKLIESLSPDLDEDDDGEDSVTTALRREKEAEADPSLIISEEEFKANMQAWMLHESQLQPTR